MNQVELNGFTRGSDGLYRKITRDANGRSEQIIRDATGKTIGYQIIEWDRRRKSLHSTTTWDGKYEHVA
jgi:hypothetical protein